MWQSLIANIAVVGLFMFGWLQLQDLLGQVRRPYRRATFGLVMGLGAVATMLLSVEFRPGVFFDLRTTFVAVAALLGGPVALAIAASITAAFRLAAGGDGLSGALLSLGAVSAIGLAAHGLVGRRTPGAAVTIAYALATSLVPLGSLALVPPSAWSIAIAAMAPMLLLNFAATAAAVFCIARSRGRVEERKLLIGAIGQAPDYLYVKDRESRIVAANGAVAEYNGYASAAELRGKTDFDFTTAERAQALFDAEQEIIATGGSLSNFEELIATRDGEPRWFQTSKIAVRNADGEVLGLAGVSRDISERKALMQALVEGRNQLDLVLTQMSDGLAHFDAEGVLKFSNTRYRDLFPLTGHLRVPGANLADLLRAVAGAEEQLNISETRLDEWVAGVMASLATGSDEEVPLFDGRWLHIRTRPMSGGGATVVVSDITNLKRAEAGLLALTEQLKLMATTDALTGLINRRGFDERLADEAMRARRNKQPLSLLMVDIDNFKPYNDRYGHQAGDECLKHVAATLRAGARRSADLVARYGGEEMCLILPETDHQGAYELAEQLRLAVGGLNIAHVANDKGVVTVSVGVATLMPGETAGSGLELIRRADAALYIAKDAGRDRVMGWGERHAARA